MEHVQNVQSTKLHMKMAFNASQLNAYQDRNLLNLESVLIVSLSLKLQMMASSVLNRNVLKRNI